MRVKLLKLKMCKKINCFYIDEQHSLVEHFKFGSDRRKAKNFSTTRKPTTGKRTKWQTEK